MRAKAFLCSPIVTIFPTHLNTTQDTQPCAQPLAVFKSGKGQGEKELSFDKELSQEENVKRETMEKVDWEHQTTMYKSEIEFT